MLKLVGVERWRVGLLGSDKVFRVAVVTQDPATAEVRSMGVC